MNTRADLIAEFESELADNSSGEITAAIMRSVMTDIINSAPNILDDGVAVPNTRKVNGQALSSDITILGNVDNTSDANKPVSLAQQTALDLKLDVSNPSLTGFLNFPTTSSTSAGVIRQNGNPFLHTFNPAANGSSLFMLGAGNFTAISPAKNNIAIGNVDKVGSASPLKTLGALTTGQNNYVLGDSNLGSLTTGFLNCVMGTNNLPLATDAQANFIFGSGNFTHVNSVFPNNSYNYLVGSHTGTTATSAFNTYGMGDLCWTAASELNDIHYMGDQIGIAATGSCTANDFFGSHIASGIHGSIGGCAAFGDYSAGALGSTSADISLLTAVGYNAMGNQGGTGATDFSSCVALGAYAGLYCETTDQLWIDNQDRGSLASQKTGSLMFGTFNATPNSQTLVLNAHVGVLTPSLSTSFLALPASTTASASLSLPHGAAPSSPVNGQIWTTSAGLFVRINGATVGPLS